MPSQKLSKERSFSVTQKASIAYIISGILSKSINLITIPLFTRVLSLEEMGITTTFVSWQTILYAIVSLSLSAGTVSAAMLEFKSDKNKYLSSALGLSTLSALVCSSIILIGRKNWEVITSLPASTIPLLLIYFILQPGVDLWYAKNKFENKYICVTIYSSISTILSGILSIICVYSFKKSTQYNLGVIKLYSQNIVLFLFALIIFASIIIKGKCLYNKYMWLWSIKLSWPLIIHSLSKNLLDISDRIMIANIRGNTESALYGTVYTICNVPLILWSAINSALIPYIFNELENNNEKTISLTLKFVIKIFGNIIFLITIISPEILKILVSPNYYETVYIMPPLLSSIFLTSLYNIYGNFLLYKKKTKSIMFGTLISVTCNVLLNSILIPLTTYFAAAYTTLLSSILLCLFQGIMYKKTYSTKIVQSFEFVFISFVTITLSLMCIFLFNTYLIRYIIFIIASLFLFKYICLSKEKISA